jgi:hypothetical protein
MKMNLIRMLAFVIIVLSIGTLLFAFAQGGDIVMIVLGLALAASSMHLFGHARQGP